MDLVHLNPLFIQSLAILPPPPSAPASWSFLYRLLQPLSLSLGGQLSFITRARAHTRAALYNNANPSLTFTTEKGVEGKGGSGEGIGSHEVRFTFLGGEEGWGGV